MKTGLMAFLMAGAALAVQGAEVKLSGWDGAPVQFEVQERYLLQKGNRTAIDFTIADDGAWAPSGPATNCVKRTDEEQPYVRFGGDDKHVGLAHGVKPAKPVSLEAGVACTLEVAARVARGTDTLIVYMKAFDAQGPQVAVPRAGGRGEDDADGLSVARRRRGRARDAHRAGFGREGAHGRL